METIGSIRNFGLNEFTAWGEEVLVSSMRLRPTYYPGPIYCYFGFHWVHAPCLKGYPEGPHTSGPKTPSLLWFWGQNSITVVYMGVSENRGP